MADTLETTNGAVDPGVWPYPIRYGQVKKFESDVVILGGGVAGVWSAIGAARQGAKVILVEKSVTARSGAGGAGCDHWQWAADNPCSSVRPEELTQALIDNQGGYRNGVSTYIQCASAYRALLELEQMGGKVRDVDDEFKGAPFRDEASKLLFAYDYDARFVLRVWGNDYKPLLRRECRRLGVSIVDRVAATGLLTKDGQAGSQVIGATGVNARTGEFNLFKAGAVINCMSRPQRNWTFSSEMRGISTFRPPTNVGNGHAMAWRAGAEFTMMEKSMRSPFASPYSYPSYGVGNAINTWFACNVVDTNGKEIPWVDANGEVITEFDKRHRPARGQKFFIMGGGSSSHPHPGLKEHEGPKLIPDLAERMQKGEFVPPFYADLTSMPDHERRVIWGLNVGEEGKTRIPILQTYSEAGFDPEQDMLQTYDFLRGSGMREPVTPQERTFGEQGICGGMVVDWDLMSTLPGLFGAGDLIYGSQDYSHAAATGRYVGRRAALFAVEQNNGHCSQEQIEAEIDRVYAPLGNAIENGNAGMDWKELNAALCRVMQNYCSEPKNAELLDLAEIWLDDIAENEAHKMVADNPHKLMRALDVLDIMTCDRMIVHACKARKASNTHLHFNRLDYPEMDPPEWHKWITIRRDDEGTGTIVDDMPIAHWGDFESNYQARI